MRLYVCGPVSGVPGGNRAAFEEARRVLADAGYRPLVPHDLLPEDAPWHMAMRVCVSAMCSCGGVCVLEGWGGSRGARLEVSIARQLKMPVNDLRGWLYGMEAEDAG